MSELLTVVLATKHEAKILELSTLLACPGVRFAPLSETQAPDLPLDDRGTIEATASEKARSVCLSTGLVALAEESGLEVDALGGRPGARSARYAHERATDAENNAALLRDLDELGEGERTARLRCVLALAIPWSDGLVVASGTCEGKIARTPRGHGGFGYDPLFVVDGTGDRALAELGADEALRVSPRVRAVQAFGPLFERALGELARDVERITARAAAQSTSA
jgi:XTP/dITP diphosphohydrolase